MKNFKKFIASATLLMMFASSGHCQEYASNIAGQGYEESRNSPSLTPAIALGAIALVAIVAVAVQNSGHHGHGHAHN